MTGGVIDDLTWESARSVLGIKTVRRTSDSAGKQNNTLADDTQLKWAVGANEVWFFEGFILFDAVNATMDAKVGLSVPAGATGYWGAAAANNTAPPGFIHFAVGATVPVMLSVTDSLTTGTRVGVSGMGIAGVIAVAGTAGDVVLQWAQATTNANDLKVLTNSSLRLTRLA